MSSAYCCVQVSYSTSCVHISMASAQHWECVGTQFLLTISRYALHLFISQMQWKVLIDMVACWKFYLHCSPLLPLKVLKMYVQTDHSKSIDILYSLDK